MANIDPPCSCGPIPNMYCHNPFHEFSWRDWQGDYPPKWFEQDEDPVTLESLSEQIKELEKQLDMIIHYVRNLAEDDNEY